MTTIQHFKNFTDHKPNSKLKFYDFIETKINVKDYTENFQKLQWRQRQLKLKLVQWRQLTKTNSKQTQSMASDVTFILKYAIKSRILILSLILLFRTLLDPYDTSASLNPPCLASTATAERHVVLLPRIGSAIENGVVWDSVYFVRVAECGYEYEQSFAFLPLLPSLISLLSRTGLFLN